MLGNLHFHRFCLDGLFIDLGPFILGAVHFHPVIDFVDIDGVEAAALRPGVVGTYFKDGLLRCLAKDIAVVGSVGHVKVAPLVRRCCSVEPPVDAAFFLYGIDKSIVMGVHAVSPSPLRPVRDAIGVSGLAVPGEEEEFMDAMIFLHGVELLEFRMGIEHCVKPELDILQLAFAGTESLGNGFRTYGGVAAGAAVVDPVAGFDHICNLFCRSLLVTNFLLNGCCHSYPSLD